MKMKHASSIRLTSKAKYLLRALAAGYGISMSAVLELMIREKAKREGVK